MQYGYRPQLRMPQPIPMQTAPGEVGFDGKMLRKAMARKTVDYNSSTTRYLENRIWQRDYRDVRALQADVLYSQQLTLPEDLAENPVNCVMTKFIRAALNKDPRPVFCVCWTPDGRRLITGASSGEFTLWNGLTFNFETILQAHTSAVRAMIWSHNEQWMLTGDDKGYVKYWQANMNNVQMFQTHVEAIRGLSFSPTDAKFASCSDDRTVRIFDFVTCKEEVILQGHGSDVKCVDWHPHKALIISGSKDSQQPIILWDARNSKKITTLHAHKNTCTDLKWNQFNGNWLISSSRDHLCKLFDLRNLKDELQSFRGHKKDACTIAWHPIYEKLFVSGGGDGSMFFWLCGNEKELAAIEDAHENIIWDVSWHPLGHMLVSGSNDRSTRFWTRNRPGDTAPDKSDETTTPKIERATGIIFKNIEPDYDKKQDDGSVFLPGLGLEKDLFEDLEVNEESNDNIPEIIPQPLPLPQQQQQQQPYIQQKKDTIPGLDFDDDDIRRRKAPYSKPIPKEFEKAWKSNKPTPSAKSIETMQVDESNKPNSLLGKTFASNNKNKQTSLLSSSSSSSSSQMPSLMNIQPTFIPNMASSGSFDSSNNQGIPSLVSLMDIKPTIVPKNMNLDKDDNYRSDQKKNYVKKSY